MATEDTSNYFDGYYNKSPGIGSVGSYQVAGYPFLTGSTNLDDGEEHKIAFPSVTKRVMVKMLSTDAIRVHFASADGGASNVVNGLHYWTLDTDNQEISIDVKCKEIYISNGSGQNNQHYEVYASLTGISTPNMFPLSGSGISV